MPETVTLLSSDAGVMPVKLGPDGKEVTIDVWLVHDQLVEISHAHNGQTIARVKAVQELMTGLGFPTPSYRAACAFEEAIFEKVAAEKKDAAPAADSTTAPG